MLDKPRSATPRAYERTINDGEHIIADTFPQMPELHKQVEETILRGIAIIAGDTVCGLVRRDGLAKMHLHFPPEFLPFLVRYMDEHGRIAALSATVNVGKFVMEIDTPFYIDETIVYRFHYPHLVGIKSRLKRDAYFKLNLNNYVNAKQEVDKALNETAGQPPSKSGRTDYHRNLPIAAWILGAHKDTWLGHTFDAMNVWWSICGVTEKTGLILYPTLFGVDLDHDLDPEHVAPGVLLPKPLKIALKDGATIVFNSDVLHGTQLNIDDLTRVVVTGRINPKKPTFYGNTKAAEYPDWHLSTDIDAKNFDNILKFPRAANLGVNKPPPKASYGQVVRTVTVNRSIKSEAVDVCDVDFLPEGEKMTVRTPDMDVVVARLSHGLRAFAALCPHLGISLADGFSDDTTIYCPGHGLAFDLATGRSECDKIKLRLFSAEITNGRIVLSAAATTAS